MKINDHRLEVLSDNIFYYRQQARLTQARLGELACCSRHTISLLETRHTALSLDLLFRIADALNVEVYRLFLERGA